MVLRATDSTISVSFCSFTESHSAASSGIETLYEYPSGTETLLSPPSIRTLTVVSVGSSGTEGPCCVIVRVFVSDDVRIEKFAVRDLVSYCRSTVTVTVAAPVPDICENEYQSCPSVTICHSSSVAMSNSNVPPTASTDAIEASSPDEISRNGSSFEHDTMPNSTETNKMIFFIRVSFFID